MSAGFGRLGAFSLLVTCMSAAVAQPTKPICAADVHVRAVRAATASINGSMLRYQMPGVKFSVDVRCPQEAALDTVGFIQVLVAGGGRVFYEAGILEYRSPRTPAIDTTADETLWYPDKVTRREKLSFTVAMSDRPAGEHSLTPPYAAARYYPAGFRSSLYAVKREDRFVTLLVEINARAGHYAVLDAYEWSTAIDVEVRNEDGKIVADILRAPYSPPSKATAKVLEALDLTQVTKLPVALSDIERWWIPPATSESRPQFLGRLVR